MPSASRTLPCLVEGSADRGRQDDRSLRRRRRDGRDAVLRLTRSRRWLAPLALAVGAIAMLFNGVKLVFSNTGQARIPRARAWPYKQSVAKVVDCS